MQLWTVSKLTRLPFALRSALRFYAPLVESLDFMGIDPCTFTRNSVSAAVWRDGDSHSIGANVPAFEFDGETPMGLRLGSGEVLQFAAGNELDDEYTLIWFHNGQPRSTPTNDNPFDANGVWIGATGVHVKHIVKAKRVLTNTEINQIQAVLEDVVQDIPAPGPAPTPPAVGEFVLASPVLGNMTGDVDGENTVYVLDDEPDPPSLIVFTSLGVPTRVAADPGETEYTLGGEDNKTITLGLAPKIGSPPVAQFVKA